MSEQEGKVVVIGSGLDYDCEDGEGPRLALDLLGVEVRDRWGCTRCRVAGCTIYVERYDEQGHGSTFALCATCAFEVLDPRPMRAPASGDNHEADAKSREQP